MIATTYGEPEEFELLRREWDGLIERDPAATVFSRPEYLSTWWEHFGAGRELALVAIREGEALRGIAPLYFERVVGRERMRFAGDPEVTDYLGITCAPEDRAEVVGVVLDVLLERRDWDRLEAGGLSADSGWPDLIADVGRSRSLRVERGVDDVCPRILLGAGFDGYLAGLPGRLRHEMTRKLRRFERETGGYTVRTSTPERLAGDLEVFARLHRTSAGEKGGFLDGGMETFFRKLAIRLGVPDPVRVDLLETSAGPAAVTFSFRYGLTLGLYNSAFDRSLGPLAPGLVLVTELVRHAALEGLGVFDFLRGSEEYKYRFGATDMPVYRLVLSRG
ncbi:MAG: GNAT family N-acetyltransferase [Actinomycetota bacterium]